MTKVRITQIRSKIDQPARQKRTLEALGLRKMHQSREVEMNPNIEGMIRKVQHLVKVEEVK